ncbi:hypothetical protein V5P93_003565 [Actinokineospora auranticolor]|uniref:Uncharacterized protein n=1 Tax=Actinokineospora auranticolor TaxID=155976 RepID=A0A2S6GPT9_9PSEU|nr:hypothetical protein [Actinokineospora auranticolor]PPK67229.1 hypothetical protein CLV40_108228 [Actinokineospora auranticolor]
MLLLMVFVTLLVACLAVVVAGWVARVRHEIRRRELDLPAYLLDVATRLLPAERREWGAAMRAELAHIDHGPARWSFTAGATWAAALPSPRRPAVFVVAGLGTLVSGAAAVAAYRFVPEALLFVVTTGVVLTGYLTVRVAWPVSTPVVRSGRLFGVVMLLGTAGCVAAVCYAVRTHPAAGRDPARLFNMVLAVVVIGYVVLAARARRADFRVLGWAAVAATGCAAVWAVPALSRPLGVDGLPESTFLAAGAVILLAAVPAAAVTGTWRAGGRVGLWSGLLAALAVFLLGMLNTLADQAYVLDNPDDVIAFDRSGTADLAGFVIGDNLGGLVLALVWIPVVATSLGLLGGALGAGLHPRYRRTRDLAAELMRG